MKIKRFGILFITVLIFMLTLSAVCAADNPLTVENAVLSDSPKTFTDLNNDINASDDSFDLKYDYTFTSQSDTGYVQINKSNFTINGNNHIIDGNRQSGIFNITGNNVIINNLIFINGNSTQGGAIYSTGQVTLNNVTFISNNAYRGGAIYSSGILSLNDVDFTGNNASRGGAVANFDGTLYCNNSRFVDNQGERGPSICSSNGNNSISNTYVTSSISDNQYGQFYASKSTFNIDNSDFINISSTYAPALYFEDTVNSIVNSRFVNLIANISVGAVAIRDSGNTYIKGCEFTNTKALKNAGTIFVDYGKLFYDATVLDCVFSNASSMFGAAYLQLGGSLLLNNSNFTNNKVIWNGGAVYLSYADSIIDNCIFNSNGGHDLLDNCLYGGAIYSDYNDLVVNNSKFINNSGSFGNSIYACDARYNITGCIFENNTIPIFTDFDFGSCNLDNNDYNGGIAITNESKNYKTIADSQALELELVNNTINVTTIPSKFDLRDWGWVTPVKNQGTMGSCWTFGTISSLESALLKAYGIEFNLSESNLQHYMLRYFPYGYKGAAEGGWILLAQSYLLGWLGPAFEEDDIYDEIGKISPFRPAGYDVVHVQDIIFVANDDIPEGTKTKSAILNYGALTVSYFSNTNIKYGYYNPETSAHYVNKSRDPTHVVSLIGWDDSFSKDNFLITPPGDGAWIVKNSWGSEWGDNGIVYISYYDKSFSPGGTMDDHNFGIVIENTVPYNKNYQYDITWLGDFADLNELKGVNGSITYANQFEAMDDDLIAAVGTYFNESGINYTIGIYVNGDLKATQVGSSPFFGYHTIKLNEYVPIKKGDIFKVTLTSNAMPYSVASKSRVHYTENMSFYCYEDEWIDLYAEEEKIACLKVYTVEDARQNTTLITPDRVISVTDGVNGYDYQFILKDENGTTLAGKEVLVSFNGKNQTVKTDEKGWGTATLKANEEGSYNVKVSFSGDNGCYGISQNATIKLVKEKSTFVAPNRTVYVQQMSRGYAYSAILKDVNGNVLANRKVLFKFNGESIVTYTDEKGYATVKLTAVNAGTHTVTIKFAGDRYYRQTTETRIIKIIREGSRLTVFNKAFDSHVLPKEVTATLKSKSGNPVNGAKVSLTVGGKTYHVNTDNNGIAVFSIDLNKLGTYIATTNFADSRFFVATSTTSKIYII